jgi:hypothetical protein
LENLPIHKTQQLHIPEHLLQIMAPLQYTVKISL